MLCQQWKCGAPSSMETALGGGWGSIKTACPGLKGNCLGSGLGAINKQTRSHIWIPVRNWGMLFIQVFYEY